MLEFRPLKTMIGLILVALALFSLPRTDAQPKLGGKVESKSKIAVFDDAERIVQEIAVLGPKLIKVLEDSKASYDDRFRAAELLGKLKYPPGIAVLIKHIGIYDRFAIVSDGPEFKCIDALAEYGDAAIPAVIDEFLRISSDEQIHEHLLLSVVNAGKHKKVARAYFKGLAPVKPDPAFEQKLERLMSKLKD